MTLTTFNKFYQHYKDDFDLELSLKSRKMTYQQAQNIADKDNEWF